MSVEICPYCKQPLHKYDKFCRHCGAILDPEFQQTVDKMQKEEASHKQEEQVLDVSQTQSIPVENTEATQETTPLVAEEIAPVKEKKKYPFHPAYLVFVIITFALFVLPFFDDMVPFISNTITILIDGIPINGLVLYYILLAIIAMITKAIGKRKMNTEYGVLILFGIFQAIILIVTALTPLIQSLGEFFAPFPTYINIACYGIMALMFFVYTLSGSAQRWMSVFGIFFGLNALLFAAIPLLNFISNSFSIDLSSISFLLNTSVPKYIFLGLSFAFMVGALLSMIFRRDLIFVCQIKREKKKAN